MKNTLLLAASIFCFTNIINAQAGQLDPLFGSHGIVKTDLGVKYNYGAAPATKLLLQPNGSVYVVQGGDYYGNAVSKRLSNGSADTSFGIKGTIKGIRLFISTAAIQSDGKIVVAGAATVNETSAFAVARYDTNGSLDSSFAGDGIQTTHISSVNTGDDNSTSEGASLIAIQKDGKIIIAGLSSHVLSLARYNSDGSVDNTFNGIGFLQSFDYSVEHSSDPSPAVLLIQDNGKIVTGGGGDQSLIRYNTDGSVDSTFSVATNYNTLSLAIQKDGKLVAVGNSITRYNIDGSVDKTFGNSGRRRAPVASNSIAIQDDGKIIVTYNASDPYDGNKFSYFNTNRYNSDGTRDSSFSEDGRQHTDFDPSLHFSPFATTAAIQADGKIVVGGGSYKGFDTLPGYFALARFNKDGSLDSTFDNDGKVTDNTFYDGNTFYDQIEIQKDKKIVVGGNTWNGNDFVRATVRYNTDGSIDSIFSNNITPVSSYKHGLSATPKNIKSSAAGGTGFQHINPKRSLNKTFRTNEKQTADIDARTNAAVTQKDGKTVSVDNNVVSRYNADGSLDKTFGVNGQQVLNFTISGHFAGRVNFTSLGLQSDQKIVLAGYIAEYTSDIAIVRLNADGSFDSTFGKDAFVVIKNKYDEDYFGYVYSCSIIIQNDDKVIVAADLESLGVWLTRLNIDGSIDSTFNETPDIRLLQYVIHTTFKMQSDGKILAGGAVLVRYNTDGSLDSTFNTNAYQQIDFAIRDIAISNNKLYVAGGGYLGTIARYLLDNNNTPPTVSLTVPANNAIYIAPANIKLTAAASDTDGTITKVEFYKDSALLHTETVAPYGYVWRNVPLGNYTITAKAYDNSGNVTTSAAVHISVVPNKAPVVNIIIPTNNQVFADTASIRFEAAASDTDGRITRVEFYKDSILLRTEYKFPYTYNWTNVAAGTYTITAKATDNFGAQTTSAPVTVTVTSDSSIVNNRLYLKNGKTALKDALGLRISPNPASNVVNIQTSGLQANKPAILSIISTTGIVLKTMRISNSSTRLDVSSLASGVYTLKIVSGDKIMYKQFVKL